MDCLSIDAILPTIVYDSTFVVRVIVSLIGTTLTTLRPNLYGPATIQTFISLVFFHIILALLFLNNVGLEKVNKAGSIADDPIPPFAFAIAWV